MGSPAVEPSIDWAPVVEGSRAFGLELTATQVDSLDHYLHLLVEWNQRFNLTAIDDPAEILVKHFLDSLSCASAVDLAARRTLIDVGSGAGFPGLVLKIVYPHLQLTLLDAVQKRLRFLERVAQELSLAEVETLHARAEDAAAASARPGISLPRRYRESFDVATARAVARLNVLSEWTLPFVKVGGVLLAMKGPEVEPEVEEARQAVRRLGGGNADIRQLVLPGTEVGRSLIVIPKVRPTPRDLPRLPGTARKSPL